MTENERTELDARVVFADLVTRVVGKEHVGRKTALGHVRICGQAVRQHRYR